MTIEPITLRKIQSHAENLSERLTATRRYLHAHPELSGREEKTAAFIAKELICLGLDVRQVIGGHGLIADLITDPSHPSVALRVDLDALPIQEVNDIPYRSQVSGVMHACGHDVHSTIGIGTAALLVQMQAELKGNIRLIFQPEEEEITGALRMIRGGALANPTPKAILGLHVAPLPVGKIAWTDDLFLAGFDHYLAVLTPQPGSPQTPEHLDAVAQRCCQVILSFNEWHLPTTWETMQNFWEQMQVGPHRLRHFTVYDASLNDEHPESWHGQFGIGVKAANYHLRRAAVGRIKASLNTICRTTHTRYHLEPMGSLPDVRNHTQLVYKVLPALNQAVGNDNILNLNSAFPFNCEDFAYYQEHIPGAMFWLGAANPAEGKHALLHTPDFDVDESCLVTGTQAMTAILFDFLDQIAF